MKKTYATIEKSAAGEITITTQTPEREAVEIRNAIRLATTRAAALLGIDTVICQWDLLEYFIVGMPQSDSELGHAGLICHLSTDQGDEKGAASALFLALPKELAAAGFSLVADIEEALDADRSA